MAIDGAREFAPAKINLCLHVTGRRADGYHLLDSLAVFADCGDWIEAAPGAGFRVTGPMAAGVPFGEENLVLRAARLFTDGGAALALDKHLPVASGLGGGSSDAAAAIRALRRLGRAPSDEAGFAEAVLALGADLPVCLAARPSRMRGIGEALSPAPDMPEGLSLVLANCGAAVSTKDTFARLAGRFGGGLSEPLPVSFPDAAALAAWLSAVTRNDLEASARELAPAIGKTLAALRASAGCLLARMSGSGATCFGLYARRDEADAAGRAIREAYRDWWVKPAGLWQRD